MQRHVDESCTTISDNSSSSNSSQLPNSLINVGSNVIPKLATPDEENQENPSKKCQFQVHEKYELKQIKILRFTSRAFAGCGCCCCSHAGQPGAVLQHATQQHRQSRNLSPKKCPHFPTETPKTGRQKDRNGFENSISQLSYLPIEVVVEIWNFGGVELVGGVSSVGNCWAR